MTSFFYPKVKQAKKVFAYSVSSSLTLNTVGNSVLRLFPIGRAATNQRSLGLSLLTRDPIEGESLVQSNIPLPLASSIPQNDSLHDVR